MDNQFLEMIKNLQSNYMNHFCHGNKKLHNIILYLPKGTYEASRRVL